MPDGDGPAPTARMPHRVLKRELAARPVAIGTEGREHELSAVTHLVNLDLVVGEGAQPALPPATHPLVAM